MYTRICYKILHKSIMSEIRQVSTHSIDIPELLAHHSYPTLPLNSKSMLMQKLNFLCAGCGNTLVNTLARLSSDAQCSIIIELLPRWLYMKQCWISICFDFECNPWFFIKSITDWLLMFNCMGLFCNKPISVFFFFFFFFRWSCIAYNS